MDRKRKLEYSKPKIDVCATATIAYGYRSGSFPDPTQEPSSSIFRKWRKLPPQLPPHLRQEAS
ncbi:hypothetical protein BDZ91DRAFT_750468 [Kalaharituber pfeilii]|nr:hypothetical protein BDZ91DRAFT_750468 [Kalaharituber pfeilii]